MQRVQNTQWTVTCSFQQAHIYINTNAKKYLKALDSNREYDS